MHHSRMITRTQVVAVSIAAILSLGLASERHKGRRPMATAIALQQVPQASEKFFDLTEKHKHPHKRGLFAKFIGAITGNDESENAPVITITSVHGYPGSHRFSPGYTYGYAPSYSNYGGSFGYYRNAGFGPKGFSSLDAYAPQTSALNSNSFSGFSPGPPQSYVSHGQTANGEPVKTITITKEVPVPYPVHVEKKVPYPVKVPVDRPVPITVPKPYAVHVDKPVPYPVKVPVQVPVPVTVEKHVPFAVKVPVDKPIPIHVPKPFPIYIERKVPYPVEKHVPFSVKYPIQQGPFPVQQGPFPVQPGPHPLEKKVPFPMRFSVERPFSFAQPGMRPYPIDVERQIPWEQKPIVVPIKVPIKIPYPVEVKVPLHIPIVGKQEVNHSDGDNFPGFGATFSGFDNSGNNSQASSLTGADFGGSSESDFFGNPENSSGGHESGRYTENSERPESNSFGENLSSFGGQAEAHSGGSSHDSSNDGYNFNFDTDDSENNSSGYA
nr:PREDICTED: uncharacterized protein LOC109042584 [Bemisia tabaci]